MVGKTLSDIVFNLDFWDSWDWKVLRCLQWISFKKQFDGSRAIAQQ